ncbi:NADPH-dependent FMN reductase [Oryzobacter telluris]|uniref:NADPH-dependent FMN reductase n=1 Tax=Oryzobacter telluris TaxID=3149179 RepID=UPI00370D50E6
MRPSLQVVVGSTRPRRAGSSVATWFLEAARGHGAFDVGVQDLAEWDLPMLDEPELPVLGGYQHDHTRRWAEVVARADAFVLVTPEYNHGYSAPLKNALDSVYAEWNDKPVGFVSYGGVSAGTRATGQLKEVVTALRMHPSHPAVNIPFVARHIDDARVFEPNPQLETAARLMLDELLVLHTHLEPLRRARLTPTGHAGTARP